MSKDYYLILQVKPGASDEEIRSAFRQRAMEVHPDVSGTNSEPFLELQEAYSVLGHPSRRAEYDHSELRPTRPRYTPMGQMPRAEPLRAERPNTREVSLFDSFQTFSPSVEEVFERIWGNFRNVTRPKAEHLESLTVDVPLSPEEAFAGGTVRVMVPGQVLCPTCHGYGSIGRYHCYKCDGRGHLVAHFPVVVSYPEGTRQDCIVRIPLDRLGIQNTYLTVRLRLTEEV